MDFPAWIPPAVIEAAKELHGQLAKENDRSKAHELLCRLAPHPLMQRVWQEIFRKKRVRYKQTEEYFNPPFTYASRIAAFRQNASHLRKKGGEEGKNFNGQRAPVCSSTMDEAGTSGVDLFLRYLFWSAP